MAALSGVAYNRQEHGSWVTVAKKFDGDVKEYNNKFLRCRGRRNHPWKFQTDLNITTKSFGGETRVIEFTQVLHCAICKTERETTYSVLPSGRFEQKGGHQYKYTDGYQLSRGSKFELDEARDELLQRELSNQLDTALFNRLIGMREDVREDLIADNQLRHLRAV